MRRRVGKLPCRGRVGTCSTMLDGVAPTKGQAATDMLPRKSEGCANQKDGSSLLPEPPVLLLCATQGGVHVAPALTHSFVSGQQMSPSPQDESAMHSTPGLVRERHLSASGQQ